MSARIALILSIVAGCCLPFGAAAQTPNPLVFDSPNQLKRYGIGFRGIGTEDVKIHFPTRCYYYGDGGWDISISDDLLATYKAQGFSRRSACMALVSGIRFNPENGKRLTSYILMDRKLIKNGQPTDAGAMSDALPLSLPSCFKNGLPYSDCAWNFDPMSGKKLSAQQTAKFKAFGPKIETFLSDAKRKSAFSYMDESEFSKGMIMVGAGRDFDVGEGSNATFYDYSSEFPKGFGYALYADGAAGPDASPEVIKAAITGRAPPSQLDADALKKIWTLGVQ
jgi:hypothetical protein